MMLLASLLKLENISLYVAQRADNGVLIILHKAQNDA